MISSICINEALQDCGVERGFEAFLAGKAVIDSREAQKGDLFIAFKGEKIDPHQFVPALCEKGVLCIGSEPLNHPFYRRVEDVLQFLTALAKAYRKRITVPVIGLTGSSGKTSTRELITGMLRASGAVVHSSAGNLNNHIGLPLTLLQKPLCCEFVVLEMGMNHAGEIRHLCHIAKPELALITNIGYAHIGNFNSREELAAAKLEIFEDTKAQSIVNGDDPIQYQWHENNGARKSITFSRAKRADITLKTAENGVLALSWKQSEIRSALPELPEYMLDNILAAAAAAMQYAKRPAQILATLSAIKLPKYRGERIVMKSREFLADCYNANPDSMHRSIISFAAMAERTNRTDACLILGSMAELGKFSEFFHKELVNLIKSLRVIKSVFLTGEGFEKISPNEFDGEKIVFFRDLKEMVAHLPENGLFLVKGSRSNRLETLFEIIGGN